MSASLPFVDDFRQAPLAAALLSRLQERCRALEEPLRIMEVCGTHTMAISRHGIRKAIPEAIELISGPGCPVCVTSNRDLDRFMETALIEGVTAATFGDMIRVPGTRTGLAHARGGGADVRVVYSVLDALELARTEPAREVVFFGIGFETTAPTVAAALLQAKEQGLSNFSVLSAHKLVPPALRLLCGSPQLSLHGFLCPGHVSAIIGPQAYGEAAQSGIPCVISGFEPVDILQSLIMLVEQRVGGRSDVELQYARGVRAGGNPEALGLMRSVFEPGPAEWRGLGTIPDSGLSIRPQFAQHDAARKFEVDVSWSKEPSGCICGSILTGIRKPADCGLFGTACTPDHPVGPCMVSSEGTCAAYFQYEL